MRPPRHRAHNLRCPIREKQPLLGLVSHEGADGAGEPLVDGNGVGTGSGPARRGEFVCCRGRLGFMRRRAVSVLACGVKGGASMWPAGPQAVVTVAPGLMRAFGGEVRCCACASAGSAHGACLQLCLILLPCFTEDVKLLSLVGSTQRDRVPMQTVLQYVGQIHVVLHIELEAP